MGTLSKNQIIEHFDKGELILNAHRKDDGTYDVEPASYDLHAGMAIWKELDMQSGTSIVKKVSFNPTATISTQEIVHLQPGQVMFVITKEEVKMPKELCGTVYAKNKFSREGILALTTGHIDPGIQCPIVIRLINLRSIPYSFHMGDAIYTIVFHTLEARPGEKLAQHPPITMQKTISNTLDSADASLANAFNDLSLTNNFVKKDEFDRLKGLNQDFVRKDEVGKIIWELIKSNIVKIIAWVVAAIVAIITIMSGWPAVKELLKKWLS